LALSRDDGKGTCLQVRRLAAGHLADIRTKIADRRAMERALSDTVRWCDAGETPGCSLIEALSAALTTP
jgi:MerR family mercuric resistance operon transcriptional regulator